MMIQAFNYVSIKHKIIFVASPGIEPGSGASEALILSIVLRGQKILNCKCRISNVKTLMKKSLYLKTSQIKYLKSTVHCYFPNPCMLVPKIFTAMASNITPKNFLTTITPLGPSAFSIHFKECNTTNITTQLINMPTRIFMLS